MTASGSAVVLGPAAIRCWAATSVAALGARRAELDRLNVFPVADSDTGTNLFLTLAEAAAAVEREPGDGSAHDLAGAFGRGALVGARGNSGVIVGQYLGALVRALLPLPGAGELGEAREVAGGDEPAEAVADGDPLVISVPTLVAALDAAATAAYQVVAEPVEGTVLTIGRAVSRHAAAAAASPSHGGTAPRARSGAAVLAVLEDAVVEGYGALLRTPGQLPALRAAGVLDAGAWGLLLVLDALAHCLGSTSALERSAAGVRMPGAREQDRPAVHHDAHGGEFEVMYLVAAPVGRRETSDSAHRPPIPDDGDLAVPLRSGLSRVGESAAVMGGDGLWQVHVHTDRPLDALAVAAGVDGVISQVRIRHLARQAGVHGRHRPPLGLVVVTAAPGLVADLARSGAVVVLVPTGGSVGPELGRAVEDTGAVRVLLLAAVPVADHPQRDGLEVLDGLTEPQLVCGASTLASVDASAGADVLLAEAVRAVRGVRTTTVPAPGQTDVAGLRHGELVRRAADRLLTSGGSLVTAVTGSTTSGAAVEALRTRVVGGPEGAELVVLDGGVPGGDIALGVE